jgi:hypothetical protein
LPRSWPGARLLFARAEEALAVGDAKEEPEPGEVAAELRRAVSGAADEPGQGGREVAGVGLQPAVGELQQLGELDRPTE